MDKITILLDASSQAIVFMVGLYVLYESFTAINEMPKISLRKIFHELRNPYTLKYWLLGLYALGVMYNAPFIRGFNSLLVMPAVICVMNRTLYRWKNSSTYGCVD